MKAQYDLAKFKSRKNPYAFKLKKPVTIRLSDDVLQNENTETGLAFRQLTSYEPKDSPVGAGNTPSKRSHTPTL